MIGFRCGCGAAIDCTYPKCKEGVEMSKDITQRLRDYADDYTTTTYHDDLIREAVTEIESMRQQLEHWKEKWEQQATEAEKLRQQLTKALDEGLRLQLVADDVRNTYAEDLRKVENELSTERMRLAACGIVAMANTPESASKARDMLPDYYSASCDDVANAVDREMELRQQVTLLREALKQARHMVYYDEAQEAITRIDEILAATKEK